MRKITLFASLITIFLIQGCVSTHLGIIQPTDVQVNRANFSFVKMVEGEAKATYFLGIGGYARSGLIKEAKMDMYSKYKFSKNQTITNLTIDTKNSFIVFPFYYQRKIIISADIIEFIQVSDYVNTSENVIQNKSINNSTQTQNYDKIYPSHDEQTIQQLYKNQNIKETNYSSIADVNIGDYVKYIDGYNNSIFAKVVDKSTDLKVKLEIFPSPGIINFEEINFTALKRVEVK